MATYTTFEAAESAVLANADFEEVGSLSKAKAFISAANAWLILSPESTSNQSSSLQVGKGDVQRLLQRAQAYVQANDTASIPRVQFFGFDVGYR